MRRRSLLSINGGGGGNAMISFTIGGVTYECPQGYTFKQFYEAGLDVYHKIGNYTYGPVEDAPLFSGGGGQYLDSKGNGVLYGDIIRNGEVYNFNTSGWD